MLLSIQKKNPTKTRCLVGPVPPSASQGDNYIFTGLTVLSLPLVKLDSQSSKLNPHYVSGFSDAESSFMISLVKRSYLKTG
jgi:hypothetical protein